MHGSRCVTGKTEDEQVVTPVVDDEGDDANHAEGGDLAPDSVDPVNGSLERGQEGWHRVMLQGPI